MNTLPEIAAGTLPPSAGGVLNSADAPGAAQRGDGPESTAPAQPFSTLNSPTLNSPQPTSPTLMAEDLDALVTLFHLAPTVSPEEIRLFAVHHTLSQLIALGWLKLASGRWTTGLYVPAGGLAERMGFSTPSPLNGERAGVRGENEEPRA